VLKHPIPEGKRRVLEALIRLIDLITYTVIAASGVFAFVATPMSISTQLTGWEWVIPLWGFLLLAGGLAGLAGRLTRIWMIEVPALPLVILGSAIYALVLAGTALTAPFVWVGVGMVIAATLGGVRRSLELQIFASEPGDRPLKKRLSDAWARRTPDAINHG